jgi:CRP-like cAMP-binding protein
MTSLDQCEALVISKSGLDRIMADRPAVSQDLLAFLCQRLRDTTEQLESIALYRIEARLARFLLALSEQTQSSAQTVDVSLAMSQAELGAVLGASRPKVNVALSNLAAMGAIRRNGSRLNCDIRKLQAVAEDMP